MEIWAALGFIALGGIVVGFFNGLAWRKYYEGKREGREYESKRKVQ